MIKNGITVFNDMYWHWEATAKAVCEMGMRGFISGVFIDMLDEKIRKRDRGKHTISEVPKKYAPYVIFALGSPCRVFGIKKKPRMDRFL